MNDLVSRHCSPQHGPALPSDVAETLLKQLTGWTMNAEAKEIRRTVVFATHSVSGLSENDFICAAKIDALGAP